MGVSYTRLRTLCALWNRSMFEPYGKGLAVRCLFPQITGDARPPAGMAGGPAPASFLSSLLSPTHSTALINLPTRLPQGERPSCCIG